MLPLDSPTVRTIERLLVSADRLYVEDLETIANMAFRMHEVITKDNQEKAPSTSRYLKDLQNGRRQGISRREEQ